MAFRESGIKPAAQEALPVFMVLTNNIQFLEG
jgi:hypothetical protein